MENSSRFQLLSPFEPTGDQPGAIAALVESLRKGTPHQALLGATGTGKTFTMANAIAQIGKPTLIISHNKTLAAQLYEEMKELFPENAVNYFVSYYDYYQPEAYIPQRDIYIEKDAARNDDLDRLRLAATSNLLSRSDVIIVASVSCIYGLGSPEEYARRVLAITTGDHLVRHQFLLQLADMQYNRNEIEFQRGCFRVRGEVIEIFPAHETYAVRIELFGDTVDRIELIHPLTGEVLTKESRVFIFPAVHYVLPAERLQAALAEIRTELEDQLQSFRDQGKLLEAQRLQARTRYDLEMIEEVGYCPGVENYAAHLEGRGPGTRPSTLLDYFGHVPDNDPGDWLIFIDESHVTVPQIRGMVNGDRARKQVLVDHGFRLPSALDNRPLLFDEFEAIAPQLVFVSATLGPYELEKVEGEVIEQIIRPTGLLDPVIDVKPTAGQVEDLILHCRRRAKAGERILVTVLTKRLAEELSGYLEEQGLAVRYLHSEIDTLERLVLLRDLREGAFDVLVGINLLREGLDLPEVSLVCILDADKAGFLRSRTSLVQTIGRAARHIHARVIMYADTVTPQMQEAIDETSRRRDLQHAYNRENNITPTSITKAIRRGIERELRAHQSARSAMAPSLPGDRAECMEQIAELERAMYAAAENLEFEQAATFRDRLRELREINDPRSESISPRP